MKNSCIEEPIEWKSMSSYIEGVKESSVSDESNKITFEPNNGWALIMPGCAGAAKGLAIKKHISIDVKLVDLLDFSGTVKKIFYKVHPSVDGVLESKEFINKKNAILKEDGYFDTSNNLRNIVIDIAGGDESENLEYFTSLAKELGYRVCLIWVLTDRNVALVRNLMRKEVIDEFFFHLNHNYVTIYTLSFLENPRVCKNVDDAWVIFGEKIASEENEMLNNLPGTAFQLVKEDNIYSTGICLNDRLINLKEIIHEYVGPEDDSYNNPQLYKHFSEVQRIIDTFLKNNSDKTEKIKLL